MGKEDCICVAWEGRGFDKVWEREREQLRFSYGTGERKAMDRRRVGEEQFFSLFIESRTWGFFRQRCEIDTLLHRAAHGLFGCRILRSRHTGGIHAALGAAVKGWGFGCLGAVSRRGCHVKEGIGGHHHGLTQQSKTASHVKTRVVRFWR